METKTIKGKIFYCPRPNYFFKKLDVDLHSKGFRKMPRILFDDKESDVIYDERGRQWFSNLINEEKFADKIINDFNWFIIKLKERNIAFSKIKKDTKQIINFLSKNLNNSIEIGYEKFSNNLYILLENFSVFLSYVHFPMADELLIERFKEILNSFLSTEEINKYIFSILKTSTYTKNAINKKICFSEIKNVEFPPKDPLILIEGELKITNFSDMDGIIFQKMFKMNNINFLKNIELFIKHRITIPIIHQISEEDFYIGRAILSCITHLFYYVALKLKSNKIIKKEADILNMELERIISLFHSVQKN